MKKQRWLYIAYGMQFFTMFLLAGWVLSPEEYDAEWFRLTILLMFALPLWLMALAIDNERKER